MGLFNNLFGKESKLDDNISAKSWDKKAVLKHKAKSVSKSKIKHNSKKKIKNLKAEKLIKSKEKKEKIKKEITVLLSSIYIKL